MSKIYSFFILICFFLVTSCISNKKLVYLQKSDTAPDTQINLETEVFKPYRIQTNDVISIRIKALDQRLVDMFNTSTTNTAQAVTPESLYFEGFTVDDHGKIRIPVLGEVAVIGMTIDEIRIKIEKQLLEEYFKKEADIFVNVKLAGLRYTINGEVGIPGSKTLF